jgi:hypothetical protein
MVKLVFQSSQGKYVQMITMRAEVKKKKVPQLLLCLLLASGFEHLGWLSFC